MLLQLPPTGMHVRRLPCARIHQQGRCALMCTPLLPAGGVRRGARGAAARRAHPQQHPLVHQHPPGRAVHPGRGPCTGAAQSSCLPCGAPVCPALNLSGTGICLLSWPGMLARAARQHLPALMLTWHACAPLLVRRRSWPPAGPLPARCWPSTSAPSAWTSCGWVLWVLLFLSFYNPPATRQLAGQAAAAFFAHWPGRQTD